jgi:hypothetical protein
LIAIENGPEDMRQQVDDMVQTTLKPQVTAALPPGDYREKLVDLFTAKFKSMMDMTQLVNQLVLVYDKHLTDDQIKSLIVFCSAPGGQKTCMALPDLMVETQSVGAKFGDEAGRKAMAQVLQENPNLAKALDEARKKAGGQ